MLCQTRPFARPWALIKPSFADLPATGVHLAPLPLPRSAGLDTVLAVRAGGSRPAGAPGGRRRARRPGAGRPSGAGVLLLCRGCARPRGRLAKSAATAPGWTRRRRAPFLHHTSRSSGQHVLDRSCAQSEAPGWSRVYESSVCSACATKRSCLQGASSDLRRGCRLRGCSSRAGGRVVLGAGATLT